MAEVAIRSSQGETGKCRHEHTKRLPRITKKIAECDMIPLAMKRFWAFIQRYDVLIVFLVLFLANAIWQPDVFLQPENLRNIINQNAAVGIVALGMTLVIVTGAIDLSVGSIMALAGVLGLLALNKAMGSGATEVKASYIAIGVCMLSGAGLGAVNGVLVAYGQGCALYRDAGRSCCVRSLAWRLRKAARFDRPALTYFPASAAVESPSHLSISPADSRCIMTWGMILFFVVAFISGVLLRKTVFRRTPSQRGRTSWPVGTRE